MLPRPEAVRTDLNQGVWWKGADQLIHAIDGMDPRYRANCARWLVDHAAAFHYRKRLQWFTWDAFVGGYNMPDEVVDEMMRMTDVEIRATIRREQDRGEHLDWIRSRPQFQALCAGLEDVLRGPFYAGVLGLAP